MLVSELNIPYQIGQIIESKMSAVRLTEAPNPTHCQMVQGILLEAGTVDFVPRSLWTYYGKWELLSSSKGSQKKAFLTVIEVLGLEKIPDWSNAETTYWRISSWKGLELINPIPAHPDCFTPYREAQEKIKKFLRLQKIISDSYNEGRE